MWRVFYFVTEILKIFVYKSRYNFLWHKKKRLTRIKLSV